MSPPPPTGLADAARRRTANTRERAIDALRRLDNEAITITYTAVADAAQVSRSWLYRQPDLRAEIDRLRQRSPGPAIPNRQRASAASQAERISDLLHANRALTEDNRKLRDQLATLLGQGRGTP